ncbi:MAG: tungstate ABC transporter [Candidatus Viridilinea halotolerans]|uniref:Tungstate ABC transporter n=1 Tax=Candidatus Viridilinea halotolerans TaxID=2491704 RepID=A0A426U5B9_9CHLR|nr:MAG: tungstate ABC transporter [Candidatus Viridilinea halotolerans]
MHRSFQAVIALLLMTLFVACSSAPTSSPVPPAAAPAEPQILRLATTTSTADSGLLEAIIPDFETSTNVRVEVIAVGTGQALALGRNGDVDVVLVHARAQEDAFVADGFGTKRRDVMYNDFVLVGPLADPAQVAETTSISDALRAIAAAEAPFASRGDNSGTHSKELRLWAASAITPTAELPWYNALGQGMGATLIAANELSAYTLTDRATWLATAASLPDLTIVFGGATIEANPDQSLYNPYGVIPVNPERHAGIEHELAEAFATWLTSAETQAAIGAFGAEQYGQPLFFAAANP